MEWGDGDGVRIGRNRCLPGPIHDNLNRLHLLCRIKPEDFIFLLVISALKNPADCVQDNASFIMRPHTEHLDHFLFLKYLINESVLNVNPTRIGS